MWFCGLNMLQYRAACRAFSTTTGYPPFCLVYARSPRCYLDTILPFTLDVDTTVSESLSRAEEATHSGILTALKDVLRHPPSTRFLC